MGSWGDEVAMKKSAQVARMARRAAPTTVVLMALPAKSLMPRSLRLPSKSLAVGMPCSLRCSQPIKGAPREVKKTVPVGVRQLMIPILTVSWSRSMF